MAVMRVHKTNDYTVMSNTHLKQREMSLKAKGLLSLMLSLPDEWDYSISGLCAMCKENEAAVKSALSELKEFGYLKVIKKLPNETKSGRIEYSYDIYETPQKKQGGKKQGVENQPLVFQPLENPTQLNTNKSITKKSNTNKKERKQNSFDDIITKYSSKFEPPICDEITDLLKEWLKVRKAKRSAMTDTAIQMNIDKLDSLSKESGLTVIEYLKEIICRGWAAFYPINTYGKNEKPKTPKEQKPIETLKAGIIEI